MNFRVAVRMGVRLTEEEGERYLAEITQAAARNEIGAEEAAQYKRVLESRTKAKYHPTKAPY
jgi:hypothetical protein